MSENKSPTRFSCPQLTSSVRTSPSCCRDMPYSCIRCSKSDVCARPSRSYLRANSMTSRTLQRNKTTVKSTYSWCSRFANQVKLHCSSQSYFECDSGKPVDHVFRFYATQQFEGLGQVKEDPLVVIREILASDEIKNGFIVSHQVGGTASYLLLHAGHLHTLYKHVSCKT